MEIDTGVDATHPAIMTHTKGGTPYDWIDNHGHGTHVAGIILKDVCPEVKLESCKFYDSATKNPVELMTLECIVRAIKEHVDIVNYSAGGTEYNENEFQALSVLSSTGITFVTAAGNNNNYLGSPCGNYYPACYALKNMFAVGNIEVNGNKASTSNWGELQMVWEHGQNIYSSLPNNSYGYMSGTSMATAAYTNRLLKKKCLEIQH